MHRREQGSLNRPLVMFATLSLLPDSATTRLWEVWAFSRFLDRAKLCSRKLLGLELCLAQSGMLLEPVSPPLHRSSRPVGSPKALCQPVAQSGPEPGCQACYGMLTARKSASLMPGAFRARFNLIISRLSSSLGEEHTRSQSVLRGVRKAPVL